MPERGVMEVKSPAEDAGGLRVHEQVTRYWGRYRLVLVTNLHEFALVGPDAAGGEATLETFRCADSDEAFARRPETPRAFAREVDSGLGEYLARALSHRAVLAEPKGMAARLLCPRWARAGRGGGRHAAAYGGAFCTRRSARRALRGRAVLSRDPGADAVLRRALRLGAVGAFAHGREPSP